MNKINIAIWGWGITGQAALNYFLNSVKFKNKVLNIDVYDAKSQESFDANLISKQPANVNLFFSASQLKKIENYNFIMASPSISETHPDIIKARFLNIPIYNDASYFIKEWKKTGKKIVGVTGSNGKSTVVSLVHGALNAAGINSILVGNIGKSPLDYLLEYEKDAMVIDVPVIELSSYQLETFSNKEFVDIAVITNISQNHLDHHNNSMNDYVEAKLKIAGTDSQVITTEDDPGIRKYVLPKLLKPTLINFENGDIDDVLKEFINENKRRLKGSHNLYNIASTLEVLKALNIKSPKSYEFIKNYPGLEHRIEFVRELDGVKYINDSKSTSPDATKVALETFGENKNIVLIAGGNDKHTSFSSWIDYLIKYVKFIVILDQEVNAKLIDVAQNAGVPYKVENGLANCVIKAKEEAMADDLVVFSPGAASGKNYKNFEERGKSFKTEVWHL